LLKSNLKITHPEIAKMAFGWDPSEFTYGSRKKMNWKCSRGHIWTTQIRDAVLSPQCRVCNNRQILIGFNDLLSTHPEIAKELQDIDPKTVTIGSNKTGVWKCKCGHTWKTIIVARKNSGCLLCSKSNLSLGKMRSKAYTKAKIETDLEIVNWLVDKKNSTLYLGSRRVIEWKCNQGHIFSARAQDFVKRKTCPVCNDKKILKGVNDLATLFPELASEAYGWDPTKKGRSAKGLLSWKCQKGHIYKAQIQDRTRLKRNGKTLIEGAGCSYCSNKKVLKGFNDLKTTHPELSSRIFIGDPETVTAGSEQIFTWICKQNHHYKATVYHKTGRGIICPVCSGKEVLIGFNDLKTINPELCKEIIVGDPEKVTAHSGKKFTWVCKSGHRWRATIASRNGPNKQSGCPKCAKTGFSSVDDGWLYLIRHEDWGLLQIGITNHPNERITKHAQSGWEALEVRGPMDGQLTRQIETDLLRFLRDQNLLLSQKDYENKFRGYTESWVEAEYPIKNLHSLIEMVDKS
jgi:hypothetical protein